MKRKEFITLLGVGAGTVVVASCLGACGKGSDAPSSNSNPAPGSLLLTINNVSTNTDFVNQGWTRQSGIIVAKTGNTYIALSAACTHEGNPVNYNSGNNTFPCSLQTPGHGSVFNADGSVKIAATANQAPLKKYTATFDQVADTLKVYA